MQSSPIHLQIYRTDDALFVYHPSMAAEAFKKGIRPALYALLFIGFIACVGLMRVEKADPLIDKSEITAYHSVNPQNYSFDDFHHCF